MLILLVGSSGSLIVYVDVPAGLLGAAPVCRGEVQDSSQPEPGPRLDSCGALYGQGAARACGSGHYYTDATGRAGRWWACTPLFSI